MEGILFGLALGDALGRDVEFEKWNAIRAKYGERGILEPADPAIYTDDTQMTLALLRGILDAGLDAPVDDLMSAVGRRFVEWLHHPETPSGAPGVTCQAGAAAFERGVHWSLSGVPDSKGCGAAMRVAPVGYLYQHNVQRLIEVAQSQAVITHRHPTGVASAVAAAYLVKLALDGVDPSDYINRTLEVVRGMSDEMEDALLRVGHVLGWNNEREALGHLGEAWIGEEAVAMALYCVLRHPDDYVACVRTGVNVTGDSDSIGCIAGGIMGARLGPDAIPADWIARCQHADEIRALARQSEALRD
jgi:ADP-ribosylglycohydrolase